jgi:hypothetical protein
MDRNQLKGMRKPELIEMAFQLSQDNLKFKKESIARRKQHQICVDKIIELNKIIKELKRKNGLANNKIAKIRLESGESPWLDILGYCILVVKNTPGYKKQLDKILESIK